MGSELDLSGGFKSSKCITNVYNFTNKFAIKYKQDDFSFYVMDLN